MGRAQLSTTIVSSCGPRSSRPRVSSKASASADAPRNGTTMLTGARLVSVDLIRRGEDRLAPVEAATDPDRALRDRVENLQWYQMLELAPGLVTPGWFDLRRVVDRIPW